MGKKNWNFWIDKGGTFTDVIALSPNNNLLKDKIFANLSLFKLTDFEGCHPIRIGSPFDGGYVTLNHNLHYL